MNTRRALFSLVLILVAVRMTDASAWRAGVARTEITPKAKVWMAGFAARTHPAEGTIHPLWAKALVIEDAQGERVVIVATDLIGLVRDVADEIGARVDKQSGIPRERILLNTSHTHSGPVVLGCADIAHFMQPEDVEASAAYRTWLVDRLVGVIDEACQAIQPATLSYGEGRATFAINRRTNRGSGFVIAPNPAGPVDHTVPVLRVADPDDKPLAVLFGYACHNTTLGSDIYQYNGDYAGFAQLAFEEKHPGVTGMFLIGCGADSNPNPRGQIEHAREHGKSLANAVDQVLAGSMRPVRGRLAVAFERVDLPFVDPPTEKELEKRRGQGNRYQKRLTESLLARIDEHGAIDPVYAYPVQVIQFGDDLTLVGLAGEVVVDYVLRLRKQLGNRPTWIAGYTNEVFAYLPSERVLAEGGYEGGNAMVYFGFHGPFKPGVEDLVVDLVTKLVDDCKRAAR